jgi:hypothetical protein
MLNGVKDPFLAPYPTPRVYKNGTQYLSDPAGWGYLLWPLPPGRRHGGSWAPVESIRWVMTGAGLQVQAAHYPVAVGVSFHMIVNSAVRVVNVLFCLSVVLTEYDLCCDRCARSNEHRTLSTYTLWQRKAHRNPRPCKSKHGALPLTLRTAGTQAAIRRIAEYMQTELIGAMTVRNSSCFPCTPHHRSPRCPDILVCCAVGVRVGYAVDPGGEPDGSSIVNTWRLAMGAELSG